MQFILRALLGKILLDASVKERVIAELRKDAAKSDSKIDDDLVEALDTVWGIAVPIIVGKAA